ncbi:anaphase-promoting complex subunit 11 [Populus alba x Populus x berolinensis]|uniref:Anaphase-promoting complex subunit 11 n=1 Tax=Populus alba x Populus x berolinensis TaxID=444605 RepID=A0AAD6LEM3_9ROSI|nr:anaphase-promoting complex subunit 11 [Populus alba x Populus x berolinensis]
MFHGTWAVIKKLCAIIFVVELFCGKFSALKFLKMQFSLTRCLLEYALDFLTEWHAVASWTWDAQDETCGICRMAFDGCCPDCKLPGDDCPLICIHLITCPFCSDVTIALAVSKKGKMFLKLNL